jgi:hypothetical protein
LAQRWLSLKAAAEQAAPEVEPVQVARRRVEQPVRLEPQGRPAEAIRARQTRCGARTGDKKVRTRCGLELSSLGRERQAALAV